ncbi:MAG: hypothetical protein PWQ91_1165 [Eubacteriales bacterium]|nr:hypothetical protein [Eubacteriales bacterium]MDN5364104.1 hypothetical protein [Eubacteriales bacterium]
MGAGAVSGGEADKLQRLNRLLDLLFAVTDGCYMAGLLEEVLGGDITYSQMRCLLYICRNNSDGEEKIRITDVAENLGVSLPAATKVVNRLAAKDLLRKKKDFRDARNTILTLTPLGIEYCSRYAERRMQKLKEVTADLSAEELDGFLDWATKFLLLNLRKLERRQLQRFCQHCGYEHDESCPLYKLCHDLQP